MTRFLFIFGFETPAQARNNQAHGWDDEESEALGIFAPSAPEALEWGCEVAERFIQRLFRNDAVSWKAQRFAHWIEPEGSPRSVSVDWSTLPVVRCGEYPDFGPWCEKQEL